jgi:lipoyl-dependent peroxiredoxin
MEKQEIHSPANPTEISAKVLYTAKDHTTGGRDGGRSRSSDGRLDVKLSFPGSKDSGTNPEQLFAAGWSACFLSAIKIAGAKMRINVPVDAAIDAELDLCSDGESYFLQARLNISLPGLENEIAMSLISSAHRICPYSNATRGNIDANIKLI